jgi:Zn-dependent protease with chaperone function
LRVFGLALLIPALAVGVTFGVSLYGASGHLLSEGLEFLALHCPESPLHCDLLLDLSHAETWLYLGLASVIGSLLALRVSSVRSRSRHTTASWDVLAPELQEKLRRVTRDLATSHRLRLPRIDIALGESRSAFVHGFFRQSILLFPDLIASLPEAELRALLLHEMAHARRYDNLQALLLEVLRRLCLFPKMFQRLVALWRLDREIHCDDLAVSTTHVPLDLASALIRASRLYRPDATLQRATDAALVSPDGAVLEARVQNLVRHADHTAAGCPHLSEVRESILGSPTASVVALSLLTALVAAWAASPGALLQVHCWVEAAVHGLTDLFSP